MRDQPDDLSPKERCLLAQLKEQHRQHAQQPGENADVVCTVSTQPEYPDRRFAEFRVGGEIYGRFWVIPFVNQVPCLCGHGHV